MKDQGHHILKEIAFYSSAPQKKEYHQTHVFLRNWEPSTWVNTSTIRTI